VRSAKGRLRSAFSRLARLDSKQPDKKSCNGEGRADPHLPGARTQRQPIFRGPARIQWRDQKTVFRKKTDHGRGQPHQVGPRRFVGNGAIAAIRCKRSAPHARVALKQLSRSGGRCNHRAIGSCGRTRRQLSCWRNRSYNAISRKSENLALASKAKFGWRTTIFRSSAPAADSAGGRYCFWPLQVRPNPRLCP
jgi:hypothetical protein